MPADTAWQDAVTTISPHVVKLSTPEGSGTGFLIYRDKTSSICGIATAAHVLDRAHEWGQPIRVRHHESGKSKLLSPEDRSIFIDQQSDTAILVFEIESGDEQMTFPQEELWLWEKGFSAILVGVHPFGDPNRCSTRRRKFLKFTIPNARHRIVRMPWFSPSVRPLLLRARK